MKGRNAIVVGAATAASGVANGQTPMSYLQTFGPAADPATRLGWGLGIVSIVVGVTIAVLLLMAIFRKRVPVAFGNGSLAVPRDAGGLAWIYGGVAISVVVLLVCMVWTLVVLAAVAKPALPFALTIEVSGNQWWWGLRYRSQDPERTFTTANEIHVPVGQPVRFELTSADVIHSFWVPQLAGKTDVIPGQTNVAWLQADHVGVYRGQCGEYCGAQHAHMALSVIADSPRDFDAWRDGQITAAQSPVSASLREGNQVFVARCGACHTVRGTGAGGVFGPDLTHLMSRRTIAAGMLPNDPGNLAAWIADAPALKPGSRMPSIPLSGPELSVVVAYLNTLK